MSHHTQPEICIFKKVFQKVSFMVSQVWKPLIKKVLEGPGLSVIEIEEHLEVLRDGMVTMGLTASSSSVSSNPNRARMCVSACTLLSPALTGNSRRL